MGGPAVARSTARRVQGTVVTLVVMLVALVLPAPAALAAGPYLTIQTGAAVGCTDAAPNETNCRQAAEIVVPGPGGDWQADDSLGLTVTGAAMAATYDLMASEQDASDGTLISLNLRSSAETSLTGGDGRGNVGLQFLANFPVSTDTVTVTGTARVEAHGTALSHSQALVQIRIGCGPDAPTTELLDATAGSFTSEPGRDDDASASAPISLDVAVVERPAGGSLGTTFCTLAVDVAADSWARQTLPPTDLATAKATLDLQVAAGPPDCALSGVVRDGNQVADGHANPLVGVLVDLVRDGAPVTDGVATDADGRYCLTGGDAASDEPGELAIRARLMDGQHDPALFHTEHSSAPGAIGFQLPITLDDFDRDDLDVEFTKTSDRPWLSEVANIHWQSARYLQWAVDTLGVSAEAMSGLTVRTFDTAGTRYSDSSRTAFLQASDSVYGQRDGPHSECPENCEWHEIAHHIGHRLVIADTTLDGPCDGREPHAGWLNATSCDSLSEGFASFLSVLGSIDIDRDRGPEYGTPEYSHSGYSLEDNTFKPWTAITHASGRVQHREDAAVAQLLWDLQDATPDEGGVIPIGGSPDLSRTDLLVEDLVALTGVQLVQIMDGAEPQTVVELYEALRASPAVPAELKVRNPDFDPEAIPQDITPLQEAFLLHGFHPVRDENAPHFELGDRVSYTDHLPQPPGYVERRHIEAVPGAALRLVNPTATDRTYVIEVDYPTTTSRFEVVAPAGGERLFGLELPPNPWVVPTEGEPPAACTDADSTITVTVSAGDVPATTFDNCAYNQALFAATGESTMTFGEALPGASEGGATVGPGGSAVPGPTGSTDGGSVAILATIAVAIVAVVVGGWLVVRRRPTA